jgi:hypothetical protein
MRIEDIEQAVQTELEYLLDKCKPTPIEAVHGTNEIELELIRIDEAISNLLQVLKTKTVSTLTMDYINKELEELTLKKKELTDKKEKVIKEMVTPQKIMFSDISKEDKRAVAYSYIETVVAYNDYIKLVWKK